MSLLGMSHKSFLLTQIFNMIYFGEALEFLVVEIYQYKIVDGS
jgi:hypothetical protein